MNMKRNLIIMGVVLALAVALVIAAPALKPAAEPTATPGPTVDPALLSLSGLTVDKVAEVTVENHVSNTSFVLNKKGEQWTIQGREGMAFDQTALSSLAFNSANVIAERLIDQNVQDLSPFGLDKPQATVTAKYSDGTANVFLLGKKTATGDTYYMMKQGDPRIVTVWMNVGNSYLASVDSMLAKQKIQFTKEDIEAVSVLKDGKTALELSYAESDLSVSVLAWRITKPWKRYASFEAVDKYLDQVSGIRMDSVVEGEPADLARYGLDKPVYDVTIRGKGKTDRLLVGADKDSSSAYAKFDGSSIVYTVSKSSLEFTKTTAYMLKDPMIALVRIDSTVGVEFSGLGQQGRLVIEQKPALDDKGEQKKDGNGSPLFDQYFSIGGKTVDQKVARYFYQTCIGLSTHSLIKEGWQPSGEPEAVLTYHRNAEPTAIKIEFMAYDNDFYAVRMEDGTFFLIKKEKVQKVADDLAKLKAGELTVPQ